MSDEGAKAHSNHTQPPPGHNMEDLQSELERVSSAMMSTQPAVPVTSVESNDDGDGPSTADESSSFITLMPPSSARPVVIPPPNFPVEAGQLSISPSTVRISSGEDQEAVLGEMTLRVGVTAATNSSVIVERPPEPPAKFMTAEEPAVESPSVKEDEAIAEEAYEEPTPYGRAEKYTCNDCGKTFSYKLSWINHKLTHAGVAPFECPKCGKAFAYNSSVLNHMKIPGRCKGRRSKPRTPVKGNPVGKNEDESSEASVEEDEGSHEEEQVTTKRQENRGQKLKQNVAADVEPQKKLNNSRIVPTPKVEAVEVVVVVPRKRGRPPKHPRPATATPSVSTPTPSTSTQASTQKAVSSKRTEEKISLAQKRRESDMHRSRSQRRIQPPMWMRNMEMDYEIPVTHGIFQGDNSRPLSTGANWREVNSLTTEKRRKSAGDSASDEDYPALQRQDIVNEGECNGVISEGEVTGNEASLTVENGNVTENSEGIDQSRGSSNDQRGRDSNVSDAANLSVEIRIPKKRGRKKKVVIEAPNVEQSVAVLDAQSNGRSVPNPANTNSPASGHDSVNSPTKRTLRGLPHRSEVVVEVCAEVEKSPIPKKKLKLEENEEELEEDLRDVNVTLPLEEDEGEEQLEQVEEMEEEEQVPEDDEDEEQQVPEDDEEEEQIQDDENLVEEEEEEEEQSQEDESMIEIEVEEDHGNDTLGMEPMNEDEDEVYQEEEEEEDTDVVEGSDNEQPPPLPPQVNATQAGQATPLQAAAASSYAPPPVGDFDLKTAAIAFLGKKISNRNMHRIRRELMELTDRGDYFQLTQWAPLAAGFLQAMLLRNFSKE